MSPPHFSLKKERLLRDISQHFDGEVTLLFEIDSDRRDAVHRELKEYGGLLYDNFPSWGRYIGVRMTNVQTAASLVDRLYSQGIDGIVDIGVDSRTVSFQGYQKP